MIACHYSRTFNNPSKILIILPNLITYILKTCKELIAKNITSASKDLRRLHGMLEIRVRLLAEVIFFVISSLQIFKMYVIKFGEIINISDCVENPIITACNHISEINLFKEYMN